MERKAERTARIMAAQMQSAVRKKDDFYLLIQVRLTSLADLQASRGGGSAALSKAEATECVMLAQMQSAVYEEIAASAALEGRTVFGRRLPSLGQAAQSALSPGNFCLFEDVPGSGLPSAQERRCAAIPPAKICAEHTRVSGMRIAGVGQSSDSGLSLRILCLYEDVMGSGLPYAQERSCTLQAAPVETADKRLMLSMHCMRQPRELLGCPCKGLCALMSGGLCMRSAKGMYSQSRHSQSPYRPVAGADPAAATLYARLACCARFLVSADCAHLCG